MGRVFLLIGGMAMAAGPAWSQDSLQADPPSETNPAAPDFSLETIDGDTFRLSQHQGEVVVLNFWATWCGPCRHEIPGFIELQRQHADRGLQFVGVALQRGAGTDAVRRYAEHMGMNYPVGVDDGTIAQKYGGVRRLPTTVVIGPEGTVRQRIPGIVPVKMLRSGLERLLPDGA